MADDDFYQSHWREIEGERLARYEEMFAYQSWHDALIEPLGLARGQVVADFGCGPGFLAMEFARRVGEEGRAYGLDINDVFLTRARQRAAEEGIANLEFLHLKADDVPLPDDSLDRLFCKNVLEYVPDVEATLAELRRAMKPGAVIEIVDSDWGFLIVEPWGKARTDTFFEAASGAYREAMIGRRLHGLLNRAGFDEVRVAITASVDTRGSLMNVITNVASYVRRFETMPAETLEEMLTELRRGIDEGTYLATLPQFVVTARNPG